MTKILKIFAATSLCMLVSCNILDMIENISDLIEDQTGYIENGQEYESKEAARLSQVHYGIKDITNKSAYVEYGVSQFKHHTRIRAASECCEAQFEGVIKDNLLFFLDCESCEFTPDMDYDLWSRGYIRGFGMSMTNETDYVLGFVFTFETDGTEPADTVFTEPVHFKIPEKDPTISIDVVDITRESARIKVGYTDVIYPTLEMKFSNWFYRDAEVTEDGDRGEIVMDVDDLDPDTEYSFIIYPGFLGGQYEGSFRTLK